MTRPTSSGNGKSSRMNMDHVSLTVRDVDRSIEFYKAVGLKVLRISILSRDRGPEYRNAYMYSGRFMLELLPAEVRTRRIGQRPHTVKKALQGSLGITHLGVRVRNLNAAITRLKAAGATMIGAPFKIERTTAKITYFDDTSDNSIHYVRRPGRKPWRIAMFSDPDGVIVELVER